MKGTGEAEIDKLSEEVGKVESKSPAKREKDLGKALRVRDDAIEKSDFDAGAAADLLNIYTTDKKELRHLVEVETENLGEIELSLTNLEAQLDALRTEEELERAKASYHAQRFKMEDVDLDAATLTKEGRTTIGRVASSIIASINPHLPLFVVLTKQKAEEYREEGKQFITEGEASSILTLF